MWMKAHNASSVVVTMDGKVLSEKVLWTMTAFSHRAAGGVTSPAFLSLSKRLELQKRSVDEQSILMKFIHDSFFLNLLSFTKCFVLILRATFLDVYRKLIYCHISKFGSGTQSQSVCLCVHVHHPPNTHKQFSDTSN